MEKEREHFSPHRDGAMKHESDKKYSLLSKENAEEDNPHRERARKHEKDQTHFLLSKENAEEVLWKHFARQKSEEEIRTRISPTPTPVPSPSEEWIAGEVIPARAVNVEQLLRFTTVENVLANCWGNIISLKESDTVEQALKIFREYEMQSAPVYNGDKFLGLVDTTDILSFFCSLEYNLPYMKQTSLKQTLKNLIEIARFSPIPVVAIGTPLSQVVKILAKGSAHRVKVLDEKTHSLFNLISQLSIIRFVAKNISLLLPEQRNKPVSEFMKWMNCIRTIPSDTRTYESFGYLYNDGISAAAVIDSTTGMIIDTVSTTDLIGLIDDGFEYMEKSIVEFLAATRRTKALKPPITCHLSDTLEYVLIKLASTKVHRLWVIEESTNLYLGLVNLTNVMEALAGFLDDEL